MRLNIGQLGGARVLAGAINGRALLSELVKAANVEPKSPELLFLDFGAVDVATASYLRESVLAFRDLIRGRRSMFYPVIANANADVVDELNELVRARGDALIACKLSSRATAKSPVLIGELDPKQQVAFEQVVAKGETDAGELMREFGEGEGLKSTTAWNNRLATLANRGLVMELSRGRAKRYRQLFEGAQ